MNMYRLDLILQAAGHFAQEHGAVDSFAHDLKTIQSSKDGCAIEDVKDVDEKTLVQAMIGKTGCVNDVVFGIISKYEEIITSD